MSTDKPTPETENALVRGADGLIWDIAGVGPIVRASDFDKAIRQRDEYARQLAEVTREWDALRVSVDRLDTELSAILEHVREAMDIESIDASAPAELVAILISQRDNANNEASAYRADLAALREALKP